MNEVPATDSQAASAAASAAAAAAAAAVALRRVPQWLWNDIGTAHDGLATAATKPAVATAADASLAATQELQRQNAAASRAQAGDNVRAMFSAAGIAAPAPIVPAAAFASLQAMPLLGFSFAAEKPKAAKAVAPAPSQAQVKAIAVTASYGGFGFGFGGAGGFGAAAAPQATRGTKTVSFVPFCINPFEQNLSTWGPPPPEYLQALAHGVFEDKSLEELRMEDYELEAASLSPSKDPAQLIQGAVPVEPARHAFAWWQAERGGAATVAAPFSALPAVASAHPSLSELAAASSVEEWLLDAEAGAIEAERVCAQAAVYSPLTFDQCEAWVRERNELWDKKEQSEPLWLGIAAELTQFGMIRDLLRIVGEYLLPPSYSHLSLGQGIPLRGDPVLAVAISRSRGGPQSIECTLHAEPLVQFGAHDGFVGFDAVPSFAIAPSPPLPLPGTRLLRLDFADASPPSLASSRAAAACSEPLQPTRFLSIPPTAAHADDFLTVFRNVFRVREYSVA